MGPSALTLAVARNNTAIVEALVRAGARDVGDKLQAANATSGALVFCTLAMVAANHRNRAVLRALAQSGSDTRAVDEDGDSVLFYCQDGATVQLMLNLGARVNGTDRYGWTVLDYAIRSSTLSVCQALINRGAKDARAFGLVAIFGDARMATTMLKAGWNVNMIGNYGWPPLMAALNSSDMSGGNTEVALVLIRGSANVNFRDRNGRSPLSLAASGGRYPEMDEHSLEVVTALLSRGAHIDAKDRWDVTPLMMAVMRLRPALVRLLVRRGANVNLRMRTGPAPKSEIGMPGGSTALTLAQGNYVYHKEAQPFVIRLLRAAGAHR